MTPDWKPRYDLAIDLARKAGDLALSYYDRQVVVEYKADLSPVTVADKGAEELIRAEVGRLFPADGFLGEEFGDQPGSSGYRWVIDPIDGTKAFIRGVPLWGTLVGLEYRGEQVAGVAYGPALGTIWHAARGDGAYKNGRRVTVSPEADLGKSIVCFTVLDKFAEVGRGAGFAALATATAQQRGWGDFYGFVLVAEGAVELMVDYGVNPWDVTALRPIVEEAGGRFTDWNDVPTTTTRDVLASNGKLHAEVLAILNTK